MCTVAFLWKRHPEARLVIGMNRDEFVARPSAPVHRWVTPRGTPIVAGKDLVSGGAWFAFGPRTFAALTNDRGGDSPAPKERSRGEIVLMAAEADGARAAADALAAVPANAFGRFHLLVSDENTLLWLTNTVDASITCTEVAPGAHVLGNFGLDQHDDPVVEALLPKMNALDVTGPSLHPVLSTLTETMSEAGPPGPCIDFGPYGTRSSAVASLYGRPSLRVSDVPPTGPTAFEDRSALLQPFASADA